MTTETQTEIGGDATCPTFKPKGAADKAQEWTLFADHNEPDHGWIMEGERKISHRLPLQGLVKIIAAHNAALAAEREKVKQLKHFREIDEKCLLTQEEEIRRIRKQLAAERERIATA